MEHLVLCPEHGYSQLERYGKQSYGLCKVETDDGSRLVFKGDRDCSSAVCEAWEKALEGTAWQGKITRYHATGNMRQMFLDSGLFVWMSPDFDAKRGDIYLKVGHTAMCLGDGRLGEFSISERGTIEGSAGDQTGNESHIRSYYGGWDGVLHYNGLANIMELEDLMSMECVFQPDDKKCMVFYDGHELHGCAHPDEVTVVDMVYQKCNNGNHIPQFKLGKKDAPWAKRFYNLVNRGWKY